MLLHGTADGEIFKSSKGLPKLRSSFIFGSRAERPLVLIIRTPRADSGFGTTGGRAPAGKLGYIRVPNRHCGHSAQQPPAPVMGLGPPARDSESSSESFLVTFYCQSLRRSVPPPWHRDNHGRKLAAITAAANLKLMVAQCQTSSQCQTSESSLCRGPGQCAAVTRAVTARCQARRPGPGCLGGQSHESGGPGCPCRRNITE